ncbi:hypothetical protein IJG44_10060 [bacterium]|nr:hypothetical protein [bacterium]
MRKSLLFLIIFLLLFNLTGEEVMKNEEGNSLQNSSEIQPESGQKKEGLKKIYIQPALGMEWAILANVAPKFSFDAEFLLKNTNVYLGFDMNLIYFPGSFAGDWNFAGDWSAPVHFNVVFAFLPYNEPSPLKSLELFLAGGVDFSFLQHKDSNDNAKGAFYHYTYYKSEERPLDDYKIFAVFPSFNIGMNFLFEYNIVLEIGIDYTLFYYLGLYTSLGYRF